MSLLELKSFMEKVKVANLTTIARHFNADPEIARDMLTIWERKGRVCKAPMCRGCAIKCQKCNPAMFEVYRWIDAAALC